MPNGLRLAAAPWLLDPNSTPPNPFGLPSFSVGQVDLFVELVAFQTPLIVSTPESATHLMFFSVAMDALNWLNM